MMANFGKRREAQREEIEQLNGGGVLRMAFVFGILGLITALALAPALNDGSIDLAFFADENLGSPIDRTVTGSVQPAEGAVSLPDGTSRYTIRRSVLQSNPAEPCYIFEDGTQQGGC
ncbi:MAG: hypothetical protein ABJM29_11985 [Rhizobiaceae bacterium]